MLVSKCACSLGVFVGQDHLLNHSFVHLEAPRFSSPSETLEFGPLNVIVCFAKTLWSEGSWEMVKLNLSFPGQSPQTRGKLEILFGLSS